jgi:hypothetical protein
LSKRKVTLKEMQPLTGSLAVCNRALPSGKTFNRPLYGSFKNDSKPHHFIRLTKGIREDLQMWQSSCFEICFSICILPMPSGHFLDKLYRLK